MRLARILTSRYSITVINTLIFMITALTVYRAAKLLFNINNNYNEIEELLDGVGIIFVAYGVALEEREIR